VAALFQSVAAPQPAALQLAELAKPVAALVEEGRSGSPEDTLWTVRNPVAGGTFKVRLGDAGTLAALSSPLSATPKTRLEADIALPADVHLDLYLLINGTPHLVQLSGLPPITIACALWAAWKRSRSRHRRAPGATGSTLRSIWARRCKRCIPTPRAGTSKSSASARCTATAIAGWAFGGNALGASYQLHNVRLASPS
jgi:hypothetical protein